MRILFNLDTSSSEEMASFRLIQDRVVNFRPMKSSSTSESPSDLPDL